MGFGIFTMITMWGPICLGPNLNLYYCVVIMVGIQWDEYGSKCGHICLDCRNYKHGFGMCKMSQLAEDGFLVYGLQFYLCITGVLIVMFFNDLCFGAFIWLVLILNRLSSLLFFKYMVFLLFL